jgi:hypothetical protein
MRPSRPIIIFARLFLNPPSSIAVATSTCSNRERRVLHFGSSAAKKEGGLNFKASTPHKIDIPKLVLVSAQRQMRRKPLSEWKDETKQFSNRQ